MFEINKIYSFEELKTYKDKIYGLAGSANTNIVFNDSAVHASLIMQCFFDKAKRINMYCGKFAIFRKEFKLKLDKMFEDSEYDGVRDSEDFMSFKPYDTMVSKMVSFFNNGGQMSVLVEEELDLIKKDPIWNTIEKYTNTGQLRFCQFLGATKLNHFTVADGKMYRSENHKKMRTALCCFNDSETSGIFEQCFDIMMRESKTICNCRN